METPEGKKSHKIFLIHHDFKLNAAEKASSVPSE
jgi:hypothetical protein